MSQAKTQMVKNYGLAGGANSSATATANSHDDENTWLPSPSSVNAARPTNTSDSASGWSMSSGKQAAGAGKEQLWSSDSSSSTSSLLMTPNHVGNNNHHHMEENYTNHVSNSTSSSSSSNQQHSQPGNYLKSIQNTNWNHLNNNHNGSSSSGGSSNDNSQQNGMCNSNSSANSEPPHLHHQQQQQRNNQNSNNSINNSNQNDLINSDTWNLFSSTPITAAAAAAISSSSSSSTNASMLFSSTSAHQGGPANSSDSNSNMHGSGAFGNNANNNHAAAAWSSSIQNGGWESGNSSAAPANPTTNGGSNFNDWQMGASNNAGTGSSSSSGGSSQNAAAAAQSHASNSTPAISMNPPPPPQSSAKAAATTLPTAPPSSSTAAAPSSRSWAKIVSQQSSPSAASLPSSASASSSSSASSHANSNSSQQHSSSSSAANQSGGGGGHAANNSNMSNQQQQQQYSFNQNSQMLNHNNSQTSNSQMKNNNISNSSNNDASSSSHDMSSNHHHHHDMNNSNEMNAMSAANQNAGGSLNYEWNIKVNQTVPWSLDGSAESKASFNKNMNNMMQANAAAMQAAAAAAAAAASNSSNLAPNHSAGGPTASNLSTTSSSSSSSSIGNEMSGLQKVAMLQQQQQQQQAGQSKSLADTGTEIWLGANPNKVMATGWGEGPSAMGSHANATTTSTPQSSSSPTSGGANNWSPNGTKSAGQAPNMMKWPMHHDQQSSSSMLSGGVNSPTEAGGAPSQWGSANPPKPQSSWAASANASGPVAPAGDQDQARWMQTDSSSPSLQAQAAAGRATPAAAPAVVMPYVLKAPIEPSGWDDPDFKTGKKSDDGTNIWGDPESQKHMKVQKWRPGTKHAPNPQTLKAALATDAEQFHQGGAPDSPLGQVSMQPPQMMQMQMQQQQLSAAPVMGGPTMMMGGPNPTVSSPTSSTTPINSMNPSQGGWPAGNPSKMQQAMGQSQWTNTPAAPSSFMNHDGSRNSPNFNPSNDWTIGLVDTTSWSTKDGDDGSMDGRHKAGRMMSGNNPIGGNPSLMNPGGLQRMTSVGNNVSGFNSSLNPGFNTQLSQPNSKNFAPSQSAPFSSPSQNLNMMLNTNNTSNIAMMAGLGGGNGSQGGGNTSNSPLNSSAPTPQIQNQLIESFRLAVQAGLISPDLLNTKLPQDVLTLLYQLFQTLNHYMNSNNKSANLQKRRTQMNPAQFKQENDQLNQEILLFKESLIGLQGKINSAHMLLKQQAGGGGGGKSIQSSSSSTSIGGNVSLAPTPPMGGNSNLMSNLTGLNATGADMELFSVVKDPSQLQQQKPKLLQLLSETPGSSAAPGSNKNPSISRQASQPAKLNSMNSSQQNFFNSPFGGNSGGSQWSDSSPFEQLPPLDDRITPFVPGQLWTGQGHSSIEDDPNCTPGSVSKPILTETFDPESILREHRNSQWSNSLTGGNDSLLLGSGLGGVGGGSQFNSLLSSGSSKTVRGGSWSTNGANSSVNGGNMGGFSTQMSLQNQNPLLSNNNGGGNSSSIGEQLWGVKSNNRVGGGSGTAPNMNRNSSAFNAPNNGNGSMLHQQQQQQQQQFYRSNSWNVTPQQQQQPAHQQLSNSQDNRSSNSNNLPLSNGHFVLIKNVQPQIDQSTLRALCAQHASGTLTYYRYIPQMTCVIVRYNSKEEANNAQSKLNSIMLNNATLYTQPLNENDLKFLFSM